MATHTVQPGDTLSAIAVRFGTTWQELALLNQLADPNLIRVGQQLVVPDTGGFVHDQPGGAHVFPVRGYRGPVPLHHGSHPGASDLFAARGTDVVAMRGGRVTLVGTEATDPHGGNNVLIRGDDGLD